MGIDIMQILTQAVIASGIVGIITKAVFDKALKKLEAIKVENENAKKENDAKNEAVRYGVQALLRHELYEMYDVWATGKGYAPISVKEDFSNMYERYHLLGANGVMDGIRDEFMNLPAHCDGNGDGDEN